MTVIVQQDDLDLGVELKKRQDMYSEIDAVVSFFGLVRDINTDKSVGAMILEYYPGMTEKILQIIEVEALVRWNINNVLIIHRVGKPHPAAQTVLVMVCSKHRGEDFSACVFLMDYLKIPAPVWKKEEPSEVSHWVQVRDKDQSEFLRWI